MSLAIAEAYGTELLKAEQRVKEANIEAAKLRGDYSSTSRARASNAAKARRDSGRRRYVDPCTSDLQYTNAETEFMMAMHEYIRSSGRKFPTHSEYLEVLISLGYHK